MAYIIRQTVTRGGSDAHSGTVARRLARRLVEAFAGPGILSTLRGRLGSRREAHWDRRPRNGMLG